uniref:Uncharacterized protein n=1 Tax=Rhizophora mucronata TaxID=61149 RepID=A0A2P2N5I7_RHIMU
MKSKDFGDDINSEHDVVEGKNSNDDINSKHKIVDDKIFHKRIIFLTKYSNLSSM